jgi:hypothetical protein
MLGALALFVPVRVGAVERFSGLPPAQPYFAALRRVISAFEHLGEPLPASLLRHLQDSEKTGDVAAAEALLAPLVLLRVRLGPGNFGWPTAGPLAPTLLEQGWRSFLVRVENPAGLTDRFMASLDTPVLGDVERYSTQHFAHERQSQPTSAVATDEVMRARLAIEAYDDRPLEPRLSGLSD